MGRPVPDHWLNIGISDAETHAIDEMGSRLDPLESRVLETRNRITRLECCHFNALLFVDQIIAEIREHDPAAASVPPRPVVSFPSNEDLQRAAATVLKAWCAGATPDALELDVAGLPGSELVSGLGQRTPLKEWQVQRAIERFEIRSPEIVSQNPAHGYVPLLVSGTYEARVATECPPRYREHVAFWEATVETLIHDTLDGDDAEISLAWAIDLLMPCHWNFMANLAIVLGAIGGDLHPELPLELCARNIRRSPALGRLERVCQTLRTYINDYGETDGIDPELLRDLGEPTPVGRWLAASLEKTVREQMGLRQPTSSGLN